MKTSRATRLVILLLATFLMSSSVSTSGADWTDHLSAALDRAFADFKARRGISFHPETEADWKQEYHRVVNDVILDYLPDKCQFRYKCESYVDELLTPAKIENSLELWIRDVQKGGSDMDMFGMLRARAHHACTGEPSGGAWDAKNKYGMVLIQTDPSNLDADVFVNRKFVARSSEIRNGVLVPRNEEISLEIRAEGFEPLQTSVIVKGDEPQRVKYIARAQKN